MLWQYEPALDRLIRFEDISSYLRAFHDYLDMYAYVSSQLPGGVILSCDHAKFFNHSYDPNTSIEGGKTLARRPIGKGEEILAITDLCRGLLRL